MIDQKTFDLIQKIADEHSSKVFGFLTKNDLKNEIWVICLTLLESYDYSRGELEHFLRRSVKNRLINKFKDITKTVRSPCPKCPFYDPEQNPDCTKFGEDRYQCQKWHTYQLTVESRNSLLNAFDSCVERQINASSFNSLISKEIQDYIVQNLPEKFQRDFQQLVSGGKMSKQRLKKLKKEVDRILVEQEEITKLTIKGQNASL